MSGTFSHPIGPVKINSVQYCYQLNWRDRNPIVQESFTGTSCIIIRELNLYH
jgi:hypothetical protein